MKSDAVFRRTAGWMEMHPGRLDFCDRIIRYRIDGATIWELPVSDIRVIGEVTTDHGPFVDDYSFCFATDGDSWFQGSFYAEGSDEFLKSLASVLGCELALRLVGSTDYDSNVLWPPHLAGTPMFSFEPVQPKTWIGRLIGSSQNTQTFSPAVLEELRGGGRSSRCI
jgi:hypothetical protein